MGAPVNSETLFTAWAQSEFLDNYGMACALPEMNKLGVVSVGPSREGSRPKTIVMLGIDLGKIVCSLAGPE